MSTINITRFVDYGYSDEGTFGRLTFNDFSCYTVERPWVHNIPSVSCIPEGYYYAEWHDSPKFGASVIIYGGTVSKYLDPNYARSAILIHPANWSNDVKGCIGLGETFTTMDGRAAVTNSRKTVANFMNLINIGEVYTLRIVYGET